MSEKFNNLLGWLEKVSGDLKIKTPAGQILFKTEALVCLLLFLAFDAALIHEIITALIKTWNKQEFTEHTLTFFLVFVGCAFLSLLLIFIREKIGVEEPTSHKLTPSAEPEQTVEKLPTLAEFTDPSSSQTSLREGNIIDQKETKIKKYFPE